MSWNSGYQVWLTESKSLENCQLIVNHLINKDWTKESISAMLGNMRHESSVNPNMYEYGYSWDANRGYGLVQWTPRSKYWDWAVANNLPPREGNSQLDRIDYEVENNIQWIPRSDYDNMTFTQFRQNTGNWSVDYLTESFTWGYERPNQTAGWNSMPVRKAFANRCFNELDWTGAEPTPKPPTPPPSWDYEDIPNSFTDFLDGLGGILNQMLTTDLYNFNNNKSQFGNRYITVTKQMDNMYKIKPTLNFKDLFLEIGGNAYDSLEDLLNNLKPVPNPDPDPEYNPDPNTNPVFPTTRGLSITSGYGWRKHPITGVNTFHASIDIGGGGVNHPIYATQSGEIIHNEWNDISGWRIRIKHNNDEYYSQYIHLAEQSPLAIGTMVGKGQRIGTMGTTGSSTGIHLDFSISKNGTFFTENDTINPLSYLGMNS